LEISINTNNKKLQNITSKQAEVPILTFHKVDSRFEWGVTRITPRQFCKILKFLKNQGYQSITLRELCDPLVEKPEKPIVITFDDSYEDLYRDGFPIMQEYGFKGTIFVITGYIGLLNGWDVNLGGLKFRHLNWNQMKEIQRAGFEFGSHTINHPDLTRIGSQNIESEVRNSKSELEDRLGEEVQFISFPFGRYNREVITICRESGYLRGCGFWISKDQISRSFVLKRKGVYLFDSLWNLRAKLGCNGLAGFEEIKLRLVNFCSHGTSMVKSNSYQ